MAGLAGEVAPLPEAPAAGASDAFWRVWGDGRAELSGYRVVVSRYGEPREGRLALIYVTEPHDRRTWVKDDHVEDPHRVEVLKMHAHLRFQTGIYPYSVTSTVFAPVARWWEGRERFTPVRLGLSVQEWCGASSLTAWAGPVEAGWMGLTYLDAPGERLRRRSLPEGTLWEDALLLQLRELDGPFASGGSWEGSLVPSLWPGGGRGELPEPVEASLERREAERDGRAVTRFVLRYGERLRTVDVEAGPAGAAGRVLAWTVRDAGVEVERAELLGTARLSYWELNRVGDERWLGYLGLEALPPASP